MKNVVEADLNWYEHQVIQADDFVFGIQIYVNKRTCNDRTKVFSNQLLCSLGSKYSTLIFV